MSEGFLAFFLAPNRVKYSSVTMCEVETKSVMQSAATVLTMEQKSQLLQVERQLGNFQRYHQ